MNRRIPNGTYGGVRGMNNLYSIGERSEPITRMLIMPYDRESQSRNADFISIARRAIHNPQRRRRCRPLSEAMQPFYTTRGASRAPFLLICGEAATTTLGPKGRQT